jgi:nitroreductase
MMLAASAIGVASCPITLHREKDAREYLGAPEGTQTRYAIALGYPTAEAQPRRFGGRKGVDAVVKYDRY